MSVATFDEQPHHLSWTVQAAMARTSHALVDDGRVWLVDPVEEPDAMERVAALGEPAGVLQLLDRHRRDCAAVAARLGVQHHVVSPVLPSSPFTVVRVVRRSFWREVALWWPAQRTLVVAEALGTTPLFAPGPGPVGVHLLLRPFPPRVLGRYAAEHLLVGHGAPVHGPAAARGVAEALERSRRDLPRVLRNLPRTMRD